MSSQDDSDEMNLQPASEPDVPASRPAETPAKRPTTAGHPGPFARAAQFIRDVRGEMKRVSWPTFEDVRNTTIIVLVNVVFFAVFLFLIDQPVDTIERHAAVIADDAPSSISVRKPRQDVRAATASYVGCICIKDAFVVRLSILGEGLNYLRIGFIPVSLESI